MMQIAGGIIFNMNNKNNNLIEVEDMLKEAKEQKLKFKRTTKDILNEIDEDSD